MDSVSAQILDNIKRQVVPPYLYAYPTRGAYRPHADIDVFDIWKTESAYTTDVINLYIHFPFCKYKCEYCNLYSIACLDIDIQDKYIDALVKQIESYRDIIASRKIKTIFMGGGTPMLLSSENFLKIVDALNRVSSNWRSEIEEFCIESSPDSVAQASETEQLSCLLVNGINRINIGIQSFRASDIKTMGRSYGETINIAAIKIMQKYGVQNVSADLIAGFAGQTIDDWIFSVNAMVDLCPNTVSIHPLRIRPDSRLGQNKDNVKNPSSTYYEWYEAARKIMFKSGYHQETNIRFTNLGKGGYRQQNYQFKSYPILGIGAGARTYTNVADYIIGGGYPAKISQIDDYIERVQNGSLKIEKAYLMTDEERVRRLLVLNLYSFDLDVVHEKFGNQFDHLFINTLNTLVEHGLIKKEGHVYSFTHEGIKYRDIISWGFVSNEVSSLDETFYSSLIPALSENLI